MTPNPSQRLERLQARAELGGGESRISRQHDRGKLTARERLAALLDPGSFAEIGAFVGPSTINSDEAPIGDGVVTGAGLIGGRPVFAFAQDFVCLGFSLR